MTKIVTIQEAAHFLGVSPQTLRRWERQGKGVPVQRTVGGQRRYDLTKLRSSNILTTKQQDCLTLAYARVSSHDQKEDL